ncbi:hypothetical protein B0A69_10055 [Chryseobacterium shigense]|nr:hypothetical protein B0A69_10055 [Chryseobacterium shigense]
MHSCIFYKYAKYYAKKTEVRVFEGEILSFFFCSDQRVWLVLLGNRKGAMFFYFVWIWKGQENQRFSAKYSW